MAERTLDEIADELYAVRPDTFAATRDERIRQARAEGQQALARELSRLRRPTQSAWLINLLWRDQREVLEQLFELANELSRAQAQASGPELHRLTAQRRELEGALIRRARALADQAGVDVSATMEREAQETLAAALARGDVADEVRTGRLVKPAAYAGFGTLPGSPQAAPRRSEPPPPAEDKLKSFEKEKAERAVRDARAAMEDAAGALATEDQAAEAAEQHRQEILGQVEQTQSRLRDLQAQADAAERTATEAAKRRELAEKAHTAAQQSLERVEQELQRFKEESR